MIKTTCPGCGEKLEAPDEAAGGKGRCAGCGEIFKVPPLPAAGPEGSENAAEKSGGDKTPEKRRAEDAREFELDDESIGKIVKALKNLEEARRCKSLKGELSQDLAFRFQAILQGSLRPGDMTREIKNIIKEEGRSSDVCSGKLKVVTDCINELRRSGIKDEKIQKEWAKLAAGGWFMIPGINDSHIQYGLSIPSFPPSGPPRRVI